MDSLFVRCDPEVLSRVRLDTAQGYRRTNFTLNLFPNSDSFTDTGTALLERPHGSSILTLRYHKVGPLDRHGTPILGLPPLAQKLFIDQYLSDLPAGLHLAGLYAGHFNTEIDFSTSETKLEFASAQPESAKYLLLDFDGTPKELVSTNGDINVFPDKSHTYVVYPVTMLVKFTLKTRCTFVEYAGFSWQAQKDLRSFYDDSIVLDNYEHVADISRHLGDKAILAPRNRRRTDAHT